MLVELLKGLWFLLFRARLQKSFNGLLVAATWLLALALLSVSVPHTVEIITLYERGEWAAREAKAIAMSLVLEIIPALTLLTALHNTTLTLKQRQILAGLSFPFVILTLHIQFSYYAGPTNWPIYPLELALPLPYGVLVCSAIIAFVWPKMERHTTGAEVAAQFAEMREGLREVAGAIRVVQTEPQPLNPQPQLRAQSEAQPQSRTQAQIAPEAQSETQAQLRAQPPIAPEAQSEPPAQLRAQPQSEAQSEWPDEAQPQSAIEELLRLPFAVGAGAADGGHDEAQPSSVTEEIQAQLDKENEALRLYRELGTYSAVAERMGFKSDRTASRLVKSALERRNHQRN
jgi:hypothetical protein